MSTPTTPAPQPPDEGSPAEAAAPEPSAAVPAAPGGVPEGLWNWLVSPAALLAILASINFLNYLDRLIIFTLNPYIEEDLGLSKTQLGLLVSAFGWVHAVATLPAGYLADRWMRKSVIVAGVGLWSVATTLGAWARGFYDLFLCRALVGLGEATYGPSATALISERIASEKRARAIGIFNVGLALGSAAGMALGGVLGETVGWRTALFLVGAPGLVLAGLAMFIHEPRRRRAGQWVMQMELPSVRALKRPVLAAVFGGGTLVTFFTWGLIFAFQQLLVDEHGVAPDRAGVIMAGVIGATLAIGTWVGGQLGDRALQVHAGGRMLVGGLGALLALPFVLACVWAPSRFLALSAVTFVAFFLPWYTSSVLATLCDVVGERYRATYTAGYFLVIQLLGGAPSTAAVGMIADRFEGSMRPGLLFLAGVGLAGGVWLIRGAQHLRREAAVRAGGARVATPP